MLTVGLGLSLPASPLLAASSSFEDYRQECLQRVKKQGLADDVGRDLCNCTIDEFKKKYSLQDFQKLIQKSKGNKASAKSLATVGEVCFEKVLYE